MIREIRERSFEEIMASRGVGALLSHFLFRFPNQHQAVSIFTEMNDGVGVGAGIA